MAVYEHYKKGENNKRLSRFLARSSTVNLSAAVVLGVAPLLFVQVVYDPFWYVSNLLSAWWAVGFLCFITVAFLALYAFYLKRNPESGMKGFGFFGWLTFGLLLLAGFCMHLLSVQFLEPEKWKLWYLTGNVMNTSGTTIYDFQISRYLHFIVPSFAITGVFMMLYGWFFSNRKDMDKDYLHWVAVSGAKMALYATLVQIIIGFWWLFSLPDSLKFTSNAFLWIGVVFGVIFFFVLMALQSNKPRRENKQKADGKRPAGVETEDPAETPTRFDTEPTPDPGSNRGTTASKGARLLPLRKRR
jgi:hypothetical protein